MVNKSKKFVLAMLLIIISLTGYGCKQENQQEKNDKPIVAVTIVPEQTFVEAVCGDLVDVVTLVPPGSSHESYEPSPLEIEKFQQSSIYFAIGLSIEDSYILPNAKGISVISLHEEVNSKYKDRTFASGDRDPHIWLSPKRVIVMIETIAEEMGKLDPENKEIYDKNAKEYIVQLTLLDQKIKDALSGVGNRNFIVFHPAFGYIAEDYELTMYSLEEEGKEATAKHLEELIDFAKEENIKVIFYQEEIDSSQSKSFAEEIGAQTIKLSPLAADYIENLEAMANTMAEAME